MKTMIYCGVNNGDGFFQRAKHFDLSIGFEANPVLCKELKRVADERNIRNIEIVNAALCDFDGQVKFNVNNNDCTSSIGRINNAVHQGIRTIQTISVRAVNLKSFLQARGMEHIDFYLSDLQGMDLTVLRTIEPLLDKKRIEILQCEVQKEDKSWVYMDLYNGYSGFEALLSKNYEKIQHIRVEAHHTEDIVWRAKR